MTDEITSSNKSDLNAQDSDANVEKSDQNAEKPREQWSSRTEYILACIGVSVGLGNLWTFPSLVYKHGGLTFQLIYLFLLLIIGIPFYFFEMSRGQYSSLSGLTVWKSCPAGVGVGWAMLTCTVITCPFYSVLAAYAVLYMGASFASELPWAHCNKEWTNDKCFVRTKDEATCQDLSRPSCNGTDLEPAAKQFHYNFVLHFHESTGVTDLGPIQWHLALCLAFVWIFVYLSIFKGIKSMGKVVYFTALFPYVVLFAMLILHLTEEGSGAGLAYFLTANWTKFTTIEAWQAGAQQVFFSLGLGNAALLTLSTFNKFDNYCVYDAFIVCAVDYLTSVLTSFVMLSGAGALANTVHISVKDLIESGFGLTYVTAPELVTTFWAPQLWSFCFFLLLFTVAIDSVFIMFEASWISFFDAYPAFFRRLNKPLVYVGLTVWFYCMGLIYITAGGEYLINLVFFYVMIAWVLVGVSEITIVMWVYGSRRYCNDVEDMLKVRPNLYVQAIWKYVCPIGLLIMTLISWMNFKPPTLGNYKYPVGAHAVGWLIVAGVLLQIPGCAIYVLVKYWRKKNILQAIQPTEDWGPLHERLKKQEAISATT